MAASSLSIMQAERLRIAAEMNLRKETRGRTPDLRRLLGHVAVLESMEDTPEQPQETSSLPPMYEEPDTTTISHVDRATSPTPATLPSDEPPELDEDSDDSDEWWNHSDDEEVFFDCENDEEHTLSRKASHPPVMVREDDTRLDRFASSHHWVEMVSEVTDTKLESSPGIQTTVVEVTD